jgi:hypothetical protein
MAGGRAGGRAGSQAVRRTGKRRWKSTEAKLRLAHLFYIAFAYKHVVLK